jgi:4-hydroxy-tetrahydrodipicolinate synthase
MIAKYCLDNDIENAAKLQLKYLGLANALFMDVNPIPVKEAMNLMGKNVGECRLPLVRMEQEKIDRLKAVLTGLGLVK